MKRRSWKADQAAPEQRWVCARLKKHKIKRGDQNLKPCKFNVAVATAVPSSAPPAKKRVNTRYLQRDRRRKLKRKVFVSGMPFKAKAADFLAEFFSSHNVAPPARVAALEKGGRKTGQAYATFETTEAADAAVALSGSKLEGGRWLEIKRVAEKPPAAKDATTGGGGDDSSSDDGDSSDSDSSSSSSSEG
jgi:RNA recognition motif-containing protein